MAKKSQRIIACAKGPGVTSEIIFRGVTAPEKVLLKKGELMDYLKGLELGDKEVFVTVGAGDIDRFVEPIKELLYEKSN